MSIKKDQAAIVAIAEIFLETEGMNHAALEGDFDEARFRAERIASMAAAAELDDLALAAANLRELLGQNGSKPRPEFGGAIIKVADELDALSFD